MAKTLSAAKKRTRIADKTNVAQNNRQLERVRHLEPSQHAVKAATLAVTGHQSAPKRLLPLPFGAVRSDRGAENGWRTECKNRMTACAPRRSKERETPSLSLRIPSLLQLRNRDPAAPRNGAIAQVRDAFDVVACRSAVPFRQATDPSRLRKVPSGIFPTNRPSHPRSD